MSQLDAEGRERRRTKVLLVVYPLVVALVVAAALIWGRRDERDDAGIDAQAEAEPVAATLIVPAAGTSLGEGAEEDAWVEGEEDQAPEGNGRPAFELLREKGLAATSKVSGTARWIAGAIGGRAGAVAEHLDEDLELDDLVRGGEKAARFAPYVGPYVRYRRARLLWREEDPELRAKAKRQVVIALAELAVDAGSGGLEKAAHASPGVLDVLEGAVDVADFAGFVLSLQEELGLPLGLERLELGNVKVDALAGRALEEIAGLERLAVTLLELEADPLLASLPPDVAARLERVAEALLPSRQARD